MVNWAYFFFTGLNCAILFCRIDVDHEPATMYDVDLYNWQGERFPRRPNQTTNILHRRKRVSTDHHEAIINQMANTDTSALVLIENIETIDKYLIGSPRRPFDFARFPLVIVIENASNDQFEEQCEAILRKLWYWYGIGNAILIAPFERSSNV